MFDIILPVRNRFKTFQKTFNTCVNFIESDIRLSGSKIIIIDNNSDDIPREFFLHLIHLLDILSSMNYCQ